MNRRQQLAAEPPEALIVTIGRDMIQAQGGYRMWLQGFMECMAGYEDGHYYCLRSSNPPKRTDVQWVYLIVENKIRFRINFVIATGPEERTFDNGNTMWAKGWILIAGPITRPPRPIPMRGFQGFRYTQKIF